MTFFDWFFIAINAFNVWFWIIYPFSKRCFVLFYTYKNRDVVGFEREVRTLGKPTFEDWSQNGIKTRECVSCVVPITDRLYITFLMDFSGKVIKKVDESANFVITEFIYIRRRPEIQDAEYESSKMLFGTYHDEKVSLMWTGPLLRWALGYILAEHFVMWKMTRDISV